jgi:hypothetical protein
MNGFTRCFWTLIARAAFVQVSDGRASLLDASLAEFQAIRLSDDAEFRHTSNYRSQPICPIPVPQYSRALTFSATTQARNGDKGSIVTAE